MSTHTSTDKGAEADLLRALTDARDLAMKNTLAARIPECGDFGSIAQNLDWALQELARRAPAPVADGLPPLPEMMGAADLGCVLETPDDWDAGYRETWKKLQIADCNRRQWRAYALQLRDLLAADRQARTSVPAAGAVQQPVAVAYTPKQLQHAQSIAHRNGIEAGRMIAELETANKIAVAWAVVAPKGGIHKLSITRESVERKAAVWREEWPNNGCCVRPLVFGDTGAAPAFGNTAQPVEQPGGWRPIIRPGQVKVGDKLRFTIGSKSYSETAKQILNAGTDREEIIYHKRNNFYLITSMAMANKGSQKNVEFLPKRSTKGATDGAEGGAK